MHNIIILAGYVYFCVHMWLYLQQHNVNVYIGIRTHACIYVHVWVHIIAAIAIYVYIMHTITLLFTWTEVGTRKCINGRHINIVASYCLQSLIGLANLLSYPVTNFIFQKINKRTWNAQLFIIWPLFHLYI